MTIYLPAESGAALKKGQLISKADSSKKQMDEFVLFPFLLFTANKSNSSVRFLGESTACQSAFQFYLTFSDGLGKSLLFSKGGSKF